MMEDSGTKPTKYAWVETGNPMHLSTQPQTGYQLEVAKEDTHVASCPYTRIPLFPLCFFTQVQLCKILCR